MNMLIKIIKIGFVLEFYLFIRSFSVAWNFKFIGMEPCILARMYKYRIPFSSDIFHQVHVILYDLK